LVVIQTIFRGQFSPQKEIDMFAQRFAAVAALWILCTGAFAQPSFDTAQLDAFVTRMMADYDVPGVGLAVIEDGEISYLRGYGVRDVTTGALVTPDTQFAIGSVTKSFTSLGIMVLVNEGLVDLDAPVTDYLPEFKLSDPASTRTVTIRNLLTHTTGLVRTDASTLDVSISAEDIITAAATTPLVGAPGETFVYSNVNAILAGEIIKRVSGVSWETFTRERVLQPLGMNTATFSVAELQEQRNIAAPHVLDVMRGGVQTTDYLALGADVPAGAVNASAAEMARYVRFQLGDGVPLLSKGNLKEMHKGQIAASDFNLPGIIAAQADAVTGQSEDVPPSLVTDEEYGFYWGVETFLEQRLVQHGGNTTGMTANVTLLPERRSGVVILANVDGANIFMEVVRLHVAEVLLGRRDVDVNATLQTQLEVLGQDNASLEADREAARSYQPQAGELSPLVGTYKSLADPEPTQVEVANERTLTLESGFQEVRFKVDLVPLGENRFMATGQPLTGVVVKFTEDAKERTIELESLLGAVPLAVFKK
jgi:CubicO group peptidase (beta-lactamase class C family)